MTDIAIVTNLNPRLNNSILVQDEDKKWHKYLSKDGKLIDAVVYGQMLDEKPNSMREAISRVKTFYKGCKKISLASRDELFLTYTSTGRK